MECPTSILIVAGMALVPFNAKGDLDHALDLDGRFYVRGASMSTARVTVARNDETMRVLTKDLRNLNLRIDLQEVYVLTFEREGCRTKSILFDTRMSQADLVRAPFTFRFDVTLEAARDEAVRYAGPVGYVTYSSKEGDFVYDLDYRLTHDEKGRLLTEGSSGPDAAAVSAKRGRAERHRVQPFIDPTMAMEREAEERAKRASGDGAGDGAHTSFAAFFPASGITVVPASITPRYAIEDQHRTVVIEQEREITIVRVNDGKGLTDYRRIRHSDGTVMHYKNGSNCTYEEFRKAVGDE